MLRVLAANGKEGRLARLALAKSRTTPDFAALRDAMPIVEDVLAGGREALVRAVTRFDGETPKALVVDPSRGAAPKVDASFARAFRVAEKRIRAYHRHQLPKGFAFRDALGVAFREVPSPLDAVGVYVPGGRAFYPSSLLMGVVPAQVARVPRIVVATPPRAYRESAELRWALHALGVRSVLLAGGAHGIAGLVSVAGVAKIVGPGNRWVAAAKHLVSGLVGVDLPAGPSEVVILASPDADAERIAADLLAQAEHDPEAVCLLYTSSRALADRVSQALVSLLETLPTRETARASLTARGLGLVFPTLEAAARAAAESAGEHVQAMGKGAERFAALLLPTAGALFVGEDTPTAFGDYLAGPNHVLPTGGAARSYSGLSVRDFVRFGRSVSFSRKAARALAPVAARLARFEGLEGHARALDLRAGKPR
ncbi:MAG: histidinol dehydrogenase [Acidobacteria bacterium]|nr:histidinol dehydrogenase [Acidobacteriota bacterium]